MPRSFDLLILRQSLSRTPTNLKRETCILSIHPHITANTQTPQKMHRAATRLIPKRTRPHTSLPVTVTPTKIRLKKRYVSQNSSPLENTCKCLRASLVLEEKERRIVIYIPESLKTGVSGKKHEHKKYPSRPVLFFLPPPSVAKTRQEKIAKGIFPTKKKKQNKEVWVRCFVHDQTSSYRRGNFRQPSIVHLRKSR